MRYLHLLLLPLIAFTLLACSEDGSNPTTPTIQQVLMPLAIGNHWNMHGYLFSDGSRLETDWTVDIIGTETDSSGNLWYIDRDDFPYRNSAQGLHIIYRGHIFRYPASPGDKTTFEKNPLFTQTVANIDTVVNTPAGAFHCIKYRFGQPDGSYYRYYYFSPGVGLVRTEFFSTDLSYNHYFELTEYSLNTSSTENAGRPVSLDRYQDKQGNKTDANKHNSRTAHSLWDTAPTSLPID